MLKFKKVQKNHKIWKDFKNLENSKFQKPSKTSVIFQISSDLAWPFSLWYHKFLLLSLRASIFAFCLVPLAFLMSPKPTLTIFILYSFLAFIKIQKPLVALRAKAFLPCSHYYTSHGERTLKKLKILSTRPL